METQTQTETPFINLILTDLHLNSRNQSFSISDDNLDYLQLEFADIEMIIMRSNNNDSAYTSLKDLLPEPYSPTYSRKESWREIPIKDPLVQQAAWAWAYLPPVTAEPDPSYFGKLKDGLFRCFKDVVMAIINITEFNKLIRKVG